MKRVLQESSAGCDKNIRRNLIFILFLILNLDLLGQSLQSVLGEKWTSGVWVTDSKTTYSYDVNGHLTKILAQSWNGVAWENASQTNNSINPDGTTNQMVIQSWIGGIWVDFLRTTYTYNASKQVLTEVTEMLILIPSTTKQTNTYTGGYLTSSLSQNWNGLSWEDKSKSTYNNDSDGNPTLEVVQTWDGIQWNNSQQTTSTYNASKKISTEVTDDWTAGNWVPHFKESYSYDGSGYLANDLSQLWDPGLPGWKNDNQSVFENNSNGTAARITFQDWSGGVWVNSDRFTYTYGTPTSVEELSSEKNFIIYPNPAHNVITIKANIKVPGSIYSITDQTGKMLLKGKLLGETTSIDITQLTNGVYFVIIGEKSQYTFKLIKQD
jgi:hypothetical protein